MGAYSDLPNFLGENLTQIAEELKYSDANIAVLEGKIELLKSNFPQVLKNIQSCIHNRDRRTPLEYAQDLVASWIFEDYIVKKIQENPLLEILLAGADKKREILPGSRVSANSDTIICFKGRKRPLEIMTDYTGYWKNYKRIDLRDSKYEKLTNSKSLFLGFSTKDTKYILLDFAKQIPAKFIPSHFPYGGKPAYSIEITDEELKQFETNELCDEIIALCR